MWEATVLQVRLRGRRSHTRAAAAEVLIGLQVRMDDLEVQAVAEQAVRATLRHRLEQQIPAVAAVAVLTLIMHLLVSSSRQQAEQEDRV